jgi:hypothetical protein
MPTPMWMRAWSIKLHGLISSDWLAGDVLWSTERRETTRSAGVVAQARNQATIM